jgi:hypothetical protein
MKTQNHFKREYVTVSKMISLYCRKHHQPSNGTLCPDCLDLEAYAHRRIERCPFGQGKPTCAKCPVHCYKPDRREQIRSVMRFAGPRMLIHHPVLAILHLLDGFRITPSRS